jgi:fibronectin type 3 domain-containing protein
MKARGKRGPMSWWRSRTAGRGRDRGFVEAGVAAAGGLLVVGAVVGNGVAAALIDMSDGQTWLADDDGRVVQINPATGQPERRLIIGEPGSELEVSQRDGQLIVTDLTTGMITAVDLASLVASGARGVDPETEVLVGGGQVVLVDLEPGTVRAVDPLTLRDLGRPFRTDDLADAVIDDEGSVWIIGTDGTLTELDYSPDAAEFVTSTSRPVAGAGPQSRLVPHAAGVTVFAPDQGSVVQVGAGRDLAVSVAALEGTVAEADFAPADLVPASAAELGRVFLLTDGRILNVDVGSLGCERPGSPAVFAGKVYVPCLGSGRVIVLDSSGARAGSDVVVPGGGDPTLVVDDGRLYVSTPADGRIVVVQPDGSTQLVDVAAAEVPVQAVDRPPPVRPVVPVTNPPVNNPPVDNPPVNNPPPPATPDPDPTTDPTGDPTDGGNGSNGNDADRAPSGLAAQLRADGTVTLTWTPPVTAPESVRVTSSDGVADQAVGPDATSLDIPGLSCGSMITLTVTATHTDGSTGTGSTEIRTADCVTGVNPADLAPTDVQAALRADESVRVTWTAPVEPANEIRVTSSDGTANRTLPAGATTVDLTGLTCGRSLTLTVTAHHEGGITGAASATATTAACAVDPADLAPTGASAALRADESVRVSWTAPTVAPTDYRVTSSDGAASQMVAAGVTSVDLSGLTCGRTLTFTITANHDGGQSGQATATARTADCPTTPPPTVEATAPTNVVATLNGNNTVTVTWTAASSGADEYRVSPNGGAATSVTGTSATLTLAAGTYTFTVTTQLDATSATSAASNAVSVAGAPGAAGTPAISGVTNNGSQVQANVTWSAAAANGAAVTYTVTYTGGSLTTTGTSTGLTINCSGASPCAAGGTLNVTVTPSNAIGTGPASSGSASVPAPPPPPPANGDSVVSNIQWSPPGLYDEMIPFSVSVSPPAGWAAHAGTCTLHVSGGGINDSRVIACNSSGSVYGNGASSRSTITAYVVASGGGVNATSATVTEQLPSRGDWAHCTLSPRICTQPNSFEPGDPDVDDVPSTTLATVAVPTATSATATSAAEPTTAVVHDHDHPTGDQPR